MTPRFGIGVITSNRLVSAYSSHRECLPSLDQLEAIADRLGPGSWEAESHDLTVHHRETNGEHLRWYYGGKPERNQTMTDTEQDRKQREAEERRKAQQESERTNQRPDRDQPDNKTPAQK